MSNYKSVNKVKGRTALGLIFSVGLIAASTASQAALWGLFEDEKDPLKTERRAPALNSSGGYNVAPDPNLVYGSIPGAQPIDYVNSAPMAPAMQSPSLPVQLNAPASPEYLGAPLPPQGYAPQNSAPQMAVPAMPPAVSSSPLVMPMQAPMPPAQLSMQAPMPMQAPIQAPMPPHIPVQQFKAGVDSDGYPKLSSMPSAPIAQPPAVNPRAENLRAELQASQNLAGKPIDAAVKPALNPQPLPVIAPVNPAPVVNNNDFIAVPPADFTPIPTQQQTMASANVMPVFPSGPSVTVRSKRSGAGTTVNTAGSQQAYMPPMPPVPPAFAPAPISEPFTPAPLAADSSSDIALATPSPLIEKAPMPPEPKTFGSAFAPQPIAPYTAPEIRKEKFVNEPSIPVASAFDAPIDSYHGGGYSGGYSGGYTGMGNSGLSNTSYTVGSSGRLTTRQTAMLPKSRYESYRRNNR